jgi:hypothetical protein
MKCFYSGAEAVGICKSCGRGLSLAWAREYPQGLACRNRCETDVQHWIELGDLSAKVTRLSDTIVAQQNATAVVSALFCMIAGAGFIYFTGFAYGLSLTNFMGAAFILFGVYALIRAVARSRRGKKRAVASTQRSLDPTPPLG